MTALALKIDAIYVAADAGGISRLSLPNYGNLFSNGSNSSGNTVLNIPTVSGQLLDFTLTALSAPNVFVAGIASSDGKYHAAYRDFAHYSDFNAPALTAGNAAYNYMNANGGLSAWTFVAWEDFIGGDYDYNDLIFAFRGVTTQVPEPASMLLLAFGSMVIAARSRRRSKRDAV